MKLAGRSVVRVVALVSVVIALTAGCSFVRPSPVKQAFLLDPALPAAVATTHAGTARVGIVTVAAPFRGKPFVFREAELKYESDFYDEFLVQPSSIVGDATVRALIAANVFAAVSPPGIAAEADWVVDALLGTGLSRPVEGDLAAAIEALNRSRKPILALDLPSGLDADTGRPLGVAVRAEATATFVAPKLGFDAPGAAAYTGRVAVIDIGVPGRILEPFLVARA